MTPKTLRTLLVVLAAAALLSSCASSRMVNLWRDPQWHAGPFRKVLVVAITRDESVRRTAEDAFASSLHADGVDAVPSYRVFRTARPSREQAEAALQDGGFDGMLTTRLVSVRDETHLVPGYVDAYPVAFRGWRHGWGLWWNEVYEPGYLATERHARVETRLWDARRNDELVWAGTSDTIDPQSAAAAAHEIAQLVTRELHRDRLV